MRNIVMRAALPNRTGAMRADIVLVHLSHNNVTPYVTWQMNIVDSMESGDEQTYWGHYHTNLEEATSEFFERAKSKGATVYAEKRPW